MKKKSNSKRKPPLLTGGNPQIAKADGDAPVRAYIAAMPGWKRDVGRRLDALIVRTVPGVRKAVRWNSPFYGVAGAGAGAGEVAGAGAGAGAGDGWRGGTRPGWFLGFHCMTKYVKVAFFRGASLRPLPPGESKQKDVRYLDIYEGDWGKKLDEKLLASWI